METIEFDRFTRQILDEIQIDGRLSAQELSKRVALSATPCWRRVKELEERGVIRRYVAILDRHKVGLSSCMLAQVSLDRHTEGVVEAFETAVRLRPEILECHVITGDADYLLKIFVKDAAAYDAFLHSFMFKLPGIRQMKTAVALREVKSETRIQIP